MAAIFGFLYMGYIWGAHWRHLKNTTELSMCGGDAALCQITLTTCIFLLLKCCNTIVCLFYTIPLCVSVHPFACVYSCA